MGKTKKRYPASRILALILAVAMSVTMIPQTALAAPADDSATENLVNDIATEGGDDADADANKGTGSDDADTNTDIDSSDADTGKNTGSDEVDGNKGDDGEMAEVNADDNTPAAKPVYEINIDGLETNPVYTGYAPFDLSRVVLKKTENGSTETVSDTVTHSWKVKGGDGNFTALAGEPVNVGEYELTLSYPAVPGVHDGANQVVACEIKPAPLTIKVSATAKLGVKAVKENVSVVVESVEAMTADQGVLTESVIALEVTSIRDAYGSSLKAEDVLKKNGDYVVDVTPSLKADASEAAKAAAKNYKLEPFAANVEMGDLTQTQIVVTLADQWKEENAVTLHVYDGKPAKVPALTTDYTYEVQYWDDTAPAGWKKLEGAVAVGEWEKYEGCNTKEDGTVEAPTDAAAYTYKLTYEDKNGVYASCSTDDYNDITVVINPAPVTVEITTKAPIKTTAGTSMTKVLSQVKYAAKAKDRDKKDVTVNVKENHIWGTGYNDANVSQIYEPVFTLQVKEGQAWKSISDADYRMEGGKEYRVIYDGKKAIYNADGTYAHRTGINSGLDEDGEEINGVSSNYVTDETPTADDKALTVEVQAGVEVDWDLSALLNDKKAGETPETAGAKNFDYAPLYANKSEYKNKVKLKPVTGADKTPSAIGGDFTYTWYQNDAEDLLDKEILDQNKANGFTGYGFEDGWNELGNIVAPTNAGIYKLEISYQDNTDDGTFYYLKEDKPAVVYYVINKVQLAITPEESEYTTLSGRTIWDFLNDKDNKISYKMLDKDGKAYTAPAGLTLAPFWSIIEETKQDGTNQFVETNRYTVYNDEFTFVNDANIRYKIQAQRCVDGDGNDLSNNYTLDSAQKAERDAVNEAGETKKQAYRDEQPLGGTADLTVKEMGTIPLNITPKATLAAYEKTYDGKALTVAAVKPKDAYTLTKTENGQQVPVEDPGVQYLCVNKTDPDDECMLEDLQAAGEYNLYACFWGNEAYAPLDLGPEPVTVPGVLIGTVTIRKCPISLSLKVADTYEAGNLRSTLWADMADYKVTGYVQNEECDDEWAFSSENENSNVWNVQFQVYEKGSKTPLYERDIFHRNKEFEIHYDAERSALNDSWYDRNYEVTTTTADVLCTFKTVAAPARISSISLEDVKELAMAATVKRDTKGDITQTVNVQEGIGYASYNSNGIKMTGNLAAFRIYAPAEFGGRIPDTAMYQNAVENAGGRVVSSYTSTNYFVVLFDAKKGAKTFSIRWEDKYVETITLNFDEKQCLGNLQDAVAPKALAFNAAPKKLAVGSSVQLDVKITKAQMGDVICLGYKSSDESVMHVNPETGYVTALQKGKKATITVYPKHMDENDDMVEIKGAKTATVTIEGTAVTAPKPVKVTTYNTIEGVYANVNYDAVSDGYRREIYVVDNKDNPSLKKAAAIEAKVKELQGNKNQWRGTFAIAPVYLDSADEDYNRDIGYAAAYLSGLQNDRPYTVYVRNVCEAKTLADGYVITQETVDAGAAGTAVSFKSRKSEIQELGLKLDEKVDGIRDVTEYYGEDPTFYFGTRTYVVDFSKLAKKGLDSKTFGAFYLNAKDAAADSADYLYRELPLKDKQDKAVYENPKLEYFVYTYDKNGNRVSAKKNEFVSVDNKGKIKLTGIRGRYDMDEDQYSDYVTVYVRDTISQNSAYINLIIKADVDSVTAKKKTVNLTVGQEVDLNDIALYNYKSGSSKLTSYHYPDMDMIAVREAIRAQKEFFKLDGTTLRAIKGGGKLELSLTDKNVKKVAKKETDATAKITFVSKDLAPVKKIKGIDITNDKFGLTFTSAGYPDAFRVEITDSSKKKIYDRRYEICGDDHEDDEEYRVHELWQVSGGRNRRVKDAYIIDSWEIKRHVKLAKESQYTVTITALYDGISSKPATGKVKTTKIPAQDGYLEDEYDFDGDEVVSVTKPRGGMSIQVSDGDKRLHGWEEDEDGNTVYPVTSLRVLSGNSYTLTANPSNRGRVNDTLVWTIGDSKVASVKAAAGTYCITLKGLKPGSTVLEVKSKILGNKVIARYDIYVVAVGDAYYNGDQDSNIRYYGDDEPEDWSEPSDPGGTGNNAPDYLPLSVGDPRKVGASQYSTYTYFSFTAPETGRYGIQSTGINSFYKKTSKGTNKYSGWNERIYNDLGWLTEGETVYLRALSSNSGYYVTINLTQRMESAENGKTVTGQGQPANFEFKAPESGQYQFSLSYGSNQKQTLYLYTDVQAAMNQSSTSNYGSIVESWLEEGDSVWLTTRYNALNSGVEYTLNAKKVSEDVTFGTPKPVSLAAGEAAYLMYTIAKSGYYRFFAEADTVSSDVSGEITVGGEVKASVSGTNFDKKLELNQGDVVCVKVTNSQYASANVTLTVKTEDITPSDLSTVTGDVTIPNGSDTLYQFTAQAAGVYQFTMTVDSTSASDAALNIWDSISDVENFGSPLATGTAGSDEGGKTTILADILLTAGQTVYVNPVNNTGSDLTVGVTGAKDSSIPEITAAGTSIELTAEQPVKATFTAGSTGFYTFTTDSLSGDVAFAFSGNNYGSPEEELVNSGSELSKKKLLLQGQTVMWTMTASDAVTVSFKAELTAEKAAIRELKLGQRMQVSLSAGEADGAVFTVPEAGSYTFYSEGSEDTYGILYDIDSVDADTCLLQNNLYGEGSLGSADGNGPSGGHNFAIKKSLTKGQTVYLKSMCYYDDQSISFTVSVGKGSQPWNN